MKVNMKLKTRLPDRRKDAQMLDGICIYIYIYINTSDERYVIGWN